MVDLTRSEHENRESFQDEIDKELEAMFSRWRNEREKLAARRQVEQYLELRRLQEQIGDVFDLDGGKGTREL